jgi:isopenicillin N synthase-like dioxygenase
MPLPLIDVSALLDRDAADHDRQAVGREIDAACRDSGFFLVTGPRHQPAVA